MKMCAHLVLQEHTGKAGHAYFVSLGPTVALKLRWNAFPVLAVRVLLVLAKHIALPALRDALHMMAQLATVLLFQHQHHRRYAPVDILAMVQVRAKFALQVHTGKQGYAYFVSLGPTVVLKRHWNAFPVLVVRVLLLLAKLIVKNAKRIAIHMRVFIAVVVLTQHLRLATGDIFVMVMNRAKLALQVHTGKQGYAKNVNLGLTAVLKRH
jgi:hypothetical protein